MQNERKKGKMKRKRGLMPCPSKGLKGFWTVQLVLDKSKLDLLDIFGQVQNDLDL